MYEEMCTLGEIFSGPRERRIDAGVLFNETELSGPERYRCFWKSGSDNSGIPAVIVLGKNQMNRFFADAATLYSDLFPISAYIHLITGDNQPLPLPIDKAVKATNESYSRIYTCIVLAEALSSAYLAGAKSEFIAYTRCIRSSAFVLCRSGYLYGSSLLGDTLEQLSSLRRLVGLEENSNQDALVYSIISRLIVGDKRAGSVTTDQSLDEMLFLLLNGRSSQVDLTSYLARTFGIPNFLVTELAGPFDRRIVSLTKITEAIVGSKADPMISAVAIGYFLNLMAPGTLRHSGVVSGLLSTYPSVLLWYFMIGAISDPKASLPSFGGVSLKVHREISRAFSFADPPSCDIAVVEAEHLVQFFGNSRTVKPRLARHVDVSVIPGINIQVKHSFSDQPPQDDERTGYLEDQKKLDRLRGLLITGLEVLGGASGTVSTKSSNRKRKDSRNDSV